MEEESQWFGEVEARSAAMPNTSRVAVAAPTEAVAANPRLVPALCV